MKKKLDRIRMLSFCVLCIVVFAIPAFFFSGFTYQLIASPLLMVLGIFLVLKCLPEVRERVRSGKAPAEDLKRLKRGQYTGWFLIIFGLYEGVSHILKH